MLIIVSPSRSSPRNNAAHRKSPLKQTVKEPKQYERRRQPLLTVDVLIPQHRTLPLTFLHFQSVQGAEKSPSVSLDAKDWTLLSLQRGGCEHIIETEFIGPLNSHSNERPMVVVEVYLCDIGITHRAG
jgi:hypothetical protein